MSTTSHAITACVLLTMPALGCEPEPLPPVGETILVVDTDLPVPRVVSRLRIDVYLPDGTWIASRDDVRPDSRDWPTSFSVSTWAQSTSVFVRLRAYPEGRTVAYRGIVYASAAALVQGMPSGDGQPRLMIDGEDRTPALEPDPLVTVDRVLEVPVRFGEQRRLRVTLHGACVANMPRLRPWTEAMSCADGSVALAPLEAPVLETDLGYDLPSEAGNWGDEPCAETDTEPERVCVPGGAFLFGDAFYRTSSGMDPQPERVFAVRRFAMDRNEVSVGRFRAAMAGGFVPPSMPGMVEEPGPLDPIPTDACTFSEIAYDREDYPLSCVSWDTARAFCVHEGGDLPSEVQWEYAALAAGRSAKAVYGWGDDPPACSRAVYGRTYAWDDCKDLGVGIQPLRYGDGTEPSEDATALGLKNMMGSLSEHVLDTDASLKDGCWVEAPRVDPVCEIAPRPECAADPSQFECLDDRGLLHGTRGGSWVSTWDQLRPVSRDHVTSLRQDPQAWVGFRCVYPVQ